MEHFLAVINMPEFFGGIPHKIMVDNLKSAVLKRTLGAARCSIPPTRTLPPTVALPLPRAMWARGTKKAGWKMGWAM